MESSHVAGFLAVLLIASWFVFIRFYHHYRHREITNTKKFDSYKKQIFDQNAKVDALIEILIGIHELGTGTSGTETKSALAKMVIDAACQIMESPAGSILLSDEEKRELNAVATKGIPADKSSTMRLKVGEGIAGYVAERGKPIVIDDLSSDTRFMHKNNIEYHLRSVISLPIKVKDKLIGILSVDADESSHFGERDIRLLTILADQSAMTIENLDLYNNLQLFYLEMVETLARALEYKEYELKKHPVIDHHRNRYFARLIAQEMNIPESIIKFIEFASLTHGIGKIGIEEAILRKPGKLTPEEYEQVKKHPEVSQKILSKVKFLSPIVPMILYHQERWDGGGYPVGLKGEEIPLGSRIVAVINAYQAMVSNKPYRLALTEKEAISELKRGGGTQFDPKVVEAFVKVLERDKAKRRASASEGEKESKGDSKPNRKMERS